MSIKALVLNFFTFFAMECPLKCIHPVTFQSRSLRKRKRRRSLQLLSDGEGTDEDDSDDSDFDPCPK